jgi:hypothetical protein
MAVRWTMGNIGDRPREVTFEPIPDEVPAPAPAPEPEPVPQPQREPEPVPA